MKKRMKLQDIKKKAKTNGEKSRKKEGHFWFRMMPFYIHVGTSLGSKKWSQKRLCAFSDMTAGIAFIRQIR